MKRHLHRLVRLASGALVLITLSGCAQLGMAASQINWFKVGSYAALRLSSALNKMADEPKKEQQNVKEEEPESPAE